jgi:hypothetical protein
MSVNLQSGARSVEQTHGADQQVQHIALGWDHYDPAAGVLFVSLVQFAPNAENVIVYSQESVGQVQVSEAQLGRRPVRKPKLFAEPPCQVPRKARGAKSS